MPINPNIAMSGQAPQINLELFSPVNQMAKFMQMQNFANEGKLNALKVRQMEAEAKLDPTSPEYANELLKVNPLRGREYRKLIADEASAKSSRERSELEIAAAKKKMLDQSLRDISGRPSDANITAWMEDIQASPLFGDVEKASVMRRAQQLISIPFEDRQTHLASQGATSSELRPNLTAGPTGIVQTPAFGGAGTVVPGTQAAFEMTPAQIAQNKIAQGQLDVSRGQLGVARERLAKDGIQLNAAENAVLATAIAEGRVDIKNLKINKKKIITSTLQTQPGIDLREMSIENIASGAGARALGTQSAKMQTAAIEADKMIDIVRTTSAAINRTEFPTINAIQNAVSKGTGGKEIVQLNTAINSLVNSYARAISPTGQPTVSDKNHAREVINSAYSTGQIDAITDIMRKEMDIAKASPKEAQEAARSLRQKTPTAGKEDPLGIR